MLGGTDPDTGVSRYCDAFAASFSKKQCIAAKGGVGAVPCTWACLSNEKVWRQLRDADQEDALQIVMVKMQTVNTMACNLLTGHGFNGHFLKTVLRRKKEVDVGLVTVPHLKDHVEALAKASTHGAIFAVRGRQHLTPDDMFKAAKLPAKKARIEQMKKQERKGSRD